MQSHYFVIYILNKYVYNHIICGVAYWSGRERAETFGGLPQGGSSQHSIFDD